jgi:hypothetical protein
MNEEINIRGVPSATADHPARGEAVIRINICGAAIDIV